jgi:hypothetical protein
VREEMKLRENIKLPNEYTVRYKEDITSEREEKMG